MEQWMYIFTSETSIVMNCSWYKIILSVACLRFIQFLLNATLSLLSA